MAEIPLWVAPKLMSIDDLQILLGGVDSNCYIEVNPTMILRLYDAFRTKQIGVLDLFTERVIKEDGCIGS